MNSPNQEIKSRLQKSLSVGALCMALAIVTAHAEEPNVLPDISELGNLAPTVICEDQTYALCAKARCFVFNGLAYCKCEILTGNSISAPFNYPVLGPPWKPKQNICDLNLQGVGNGFKASTFSLPVETLKGGNKAVYTCPATSLGAYAQCDGGICFDSTSGNSFPGFRKPLNEKEIICSCPITKESTANDPFGYQFIGPYPCRRKVFRLCGLKTNGLDGTTIPVGAPTGVPRFLSIMLDGTNPDVNECFP